MIEGLAPYPRYKHSGSPWLGDVPAHWETHRLKAVVANVVEQTSSMRGDDVYVALEHVEGWTGRVRPARGQSLFTGQVKRFAPNDVLFGKLRPYLAKVTRLDCAGVCVGEFFVLRAVRTAAAQPYLEQLLRCRLTIDAVNGSTFGAKMPRADWEFVGNMSFGFPPAEEQAGIVRFLDHAGAKIERAVRAKRKLIALLNEQKQAIIHRAVTRGLDPAVKLKPSGIPWLGDVPEHWEVRRMKTISKIRYGLGQPPRESAQGVPLIRATNVDHGRIVRNKMVHVDLNDVPKGRNALLAQDEIIVVRSGAYTADSAIIPQEYEGTVAGYDMVVTVTGAVPHFVALALLSNYLKVDQLITASMRAAQPHLNAEELGNSIVLLPPIGVQTAIIEATSTLTVTFDTAISRAEREIELLREYRTTLTAAVVTGKLDVRDAARGLPTSADALPSEDGPDDADEPDEAD